jgi:uncharacterized membrane protein
MEAAVREAVELAIPVVEAVGAVIVFVGALRAFVLWVLAQLNVHDTPYDGVRLLLGRHLALGLEFQLGADILSTAVAPSFEELGKLAIIATIRTVLNVFLQRELKEEAERLRATGT